MDTEKIIEVLNRSRRINLKEREPLPEGEAYIVGASNEHYDVIHYYYGLDYTNHDPEQNTFGGYVVKEGEEPIRSAFRRYIKFMRTGIGKSERGYRDKMVDALGTDEMVELFCKEVLTYNSR